MIFLMKFLPDLNVGNVGGIKMNANVNFPVVKVTWIDSESHDAWTTEEDIKKESPELHCISIGYLIRKPTKKTPAYYVASTRTVPRDGEQRQFACTMKIPAICVKSVQELEDVD